MTVGREPLERRVASGWILAGLFLLLLLPACLDVTRYHGDERFYTDAAVSMVKSGDWLSPRYPDGRLRVEKPILSYVVLAASYETLGVSLFASRLPFAVAGALLVGVTWQAGLLLLRDRRAALLGAALVASNPHVLSLSGRSTPDILLCLFLLLGFMGFAALLRGDEGSAPRAMAWLGTGAGVAAKGGLGLVLLAYAVACAAASRDRAVRLRRLFDPVFLPLGLALAAGGFGVYALVHGPGALAGSVYDQVGGRNGRGMGLLPGLLPYLRVPFEQLAPWLALLALGAVRGRAAIGEFLRAHAFVVRFALGWLGVTILVFSFGALVRGRYLAPALPPAVLVLAGALVAAARSDEAETWLRRGALAFLAIVAAGGLALAAIGARVGPGLVAAGALPAVAAATGLAFTRRRNATAALVSLAVTLLVAQTAGLAGVRETFARSPVPEIAARLLDPALEGLRIAQVGESAHLASKLRVATGGLEIDGHWRRKGEPDPSRYDVIVSDRPFDASVVAAGFRVEPCGESFGDDWTPAEVIAVLRADDPAARLARRAEPYWLAIRGAPAGG